MVAVTNPGLLLTNTDLTIKAMSLSMSVKTLVKSMTVLAASSSTLTSVIGLRTVGASSTGLTVMTKLVTLILPPAPSATVKLKLSLVVSPPL